MEKDTMDRFKKAIAEEQNSGTMDTVDRQEILQKIKEKYRLKNERKSE